MPVVLNLDGYHPKYKVPNDTWRISIDSKGRDDVKGYWNLSYQPGVLHWDELSKLKKLSNLDYSGPDATIVDYIRSKKCTIREFTWTENCQSRFDFSDAPRLENLGLGVHKLKVHLKLPTNGKFSYLRLLHPPRNWKATVICPHKGRGVTLLIYAGSLSAIAGLKEIETLYLFEASQVDIAAIGKAYPNIRRLCISGTSVTVTNIEALTKLKQLEELEIRECYSINVAALPDAAQLPSLIVADFDGLRADDAKVIASKLKDIEELSIRGKRSDAWIATNLQNPFRNWDEDFGKAAGTKAANAWKVAVSEIEKLSNPIRSEKAKAILSKFVTAFSKLDSRSGLETDQREQIHDAFLSLANRLPKGMVTEDDYTTWADYA